MGPALTVEWRKPRSAEASHVTRCESVWRDDPRSNAVLDDLQTALEQAQTYGATTPPATAPSAAPK